MESKTQSARNFERKTSGYASLGGGVFISPKSIVSINAPGLELVFNVETIDVEIDVGDNGVAHLIMSTKAWDILKGGGKIKTKSIKEFKKSIR